MNTTERDWDLIESIKQQLEIHTANKESQRELLDIVDVELEELPEDPTT